MRRQDLHLIIALSGVDERTLRRWLRGQNVREATRERIARAARELKIKLPAEAM